METDPPDRPPAETQAAPVIDLDAIRQANAERKARQDAATPGNWQADGPYDADEFYGDYYEIWRWDETNYRDRIGLVFSPGYEFGSRKQQDAALFAAARTDEAPAVIEALCAEVERLRAEQSPVWALLREIHQTLPDMQDTLNHDERHCYVGCLDRQGNHVPCTCGVAESKATMDTWIAGISLLLVTSL